MKAILAAAALLVFWGCGSSSPPTPEDPAVKNSLEQFFLQFRQQVQAGNPDSLVKGLSRETLFWLEDIRHAARTEAPRYLEARPFHEVLCVLALRVERRLNPSFDDRAPGLIQKLVVENHSVKRTLLKNDLGDPRVRGDEGEFGLREAPSVPVFFFMRENGAWKFNLVRSLPLILKGAESMARQRKPTRIEQAAFILGQFGNLEVVPEDLAR
jgi:hypothetical protein